MNDLMDLGTLSINLNVLKAMTTCGTGLVDDGTDRGVHDGYLDMLKQLAPLYSNTRLINKLLSGYARAGIFLTSKDAVIDISDSYLDRNAAAGPHVYSLDRTRLRLQCRPLRQYRHTTFQH